MSDAGGHHDQVPHGTSPLPADLTEAPSPPDRSAVGSQLLVQMAGRGGSGKSTLGRRIAERLGGVVLDLDAIKSALLEVGLNWNDASKGSYAAIYALVDDALAVSNAVVVVDTPSYWSEIHQRLTDAADRHAAGYVFVECGADEDVRARRLAERPTRRSQSPELQTNPVDAPAEARDVHDRPIQRPTGRRCITVSTNEPVDLEELLAEIVHLGE